MFIYQPVNKINTERNVSLAGISEIRSDRMWIHNINKNDKSHEATSVGE